LTNWWTTIRHEAIELPLRLFRIIKVPSIEHLAFVPEHFLDSDRVVPEIIRAIMIDTTDVFFLARKFPQPGAAIHLLAGYGAHPDFPIADITKNFWPVCCPRIDFTGGSR